MKRTKSTVCSVCGEPRCEKAKAQALCEAHLKEYWRQSKSKRQTVKKAASLPSSVRPKVTVTGDRVTMDMATFEKLMKQRAPQPQQPPKPAGQRLAVVSADLARVLLVEATAGTVQELDDSQYAQQLREAGYAVCVEG
jgi:hypothetical protein